MKLRFFLTEIHRFFSSNIHLAMSTKVKKSSIGSSAAPSTSEKERLSDEESSSIYESDLDENFNDYYDYDDPKPVKIDRCDSSDEEDLRNTVGNVPISWYDDYDHIGYTADGRKLAKSAGKTSEIDSFLAKMDDPNYWRTIKDKQTGKNVVLPDEVVGLLGNIQSAKYPKIGYNPYQPFLDIFSHETMLHPIVGEMDHKRSFTVSKTEAKKIAKIVKAIRKGLMKPRKSEQESQKNDNYDLWNDDKDVEKSKSQIARFKMHVPAPKMKLPGHAESYNPPEEYLFTEEEQEKWLKDDAEDRKLDFLPRKFNCLRKVPQYANFAKDRFARCVDLYLAPRKRKMRLNVDAEDLLPKLPEPKNLRPFPTVLSLNFKGHNGRQCSCLTFEPCNGQYFASSGDDDCVKLWEIQSGRCYKTIKFQDKNSNIRSLAFCPDTKKSLLAVAIGTNLYLVNAGVGDRLIVSDTEVVIKKLSSLIIDVEEDKTTSWKLENNMIRVSHTKTISQVVWHPAGDYFATVCPEAGNKSVLVHQLSKMKSQSIFAKQKGVVQKVVFHPTKPYFFVANERNIRIYNLMKQQLVKKLQSNCKNISSIAIHPRGDNIIASSFDARLDWFDLDLSTKPYKSLNKYHKSAINSVCFHQRYPLFASCSSDGTALVSHGMVYSDLMQNPLIVPLKILQTGSTKSKLEFLHCVFHPHQPWLLAACSDGSIKLFT
uniref:Ribosome biogenesis protein BOP1 homolog n=1 Tax=Romanomermis culicivorax TaxID=13658 RepID=A0A915J0I3_ROMCU